MSETAGAGSTTGQEIAIVGMSGRFPGARDLEEFWRNLREGVASVSRFTEEELAASGIPPRVFRDPAYVPASGVLEGAELFDAAFFGFAPREAAVLNPQHRVFLECAWEALETAGYDSGSYGGRIGVYASGGQNRYFLNVMSQRELRESVGEFQAFLWNSDSIATQTSFRLDLQGPSINVQTACSSSLVAVHLACQSLLVGESDMALAGGIYVGLPQKRGYAYRPQGILSPTGQCRAFDADARGTVGGSGVGVVVLKRLEDALADGDTVHAVIRGSAVNNDGARKVGYTAPRREGQAAVVAEALSVAGVEPEEVSYVEAHGSGTEVGDPIEVAALAAAFGDTERKGFCALGSVKTNVGHLDAAAGVTGLIKTVLALEHGEIPPSLHYERPNPKIDFASTPFFVNAGLRRWEGRDGPRRAGVSSFGMGGTNAHVVLEEAPPAEPSGPSRPWQLLVLAARTPAALEAATDRLAEHLRAHPEQELADVAHTLRVGRRRFAHRRVLVCRGREDAAAALAARDPRRLLDVAQEREERPVAFLFPGLGDHYAQMARGLYEAEPAFRREVDRCAEILRPRLGADLRDALFPGAPPAAQRADADGAPAGETDLRRMLGRSAEAAADPLGRTELAHPAVFVTGYALARTWMEWGVRPEIMIGHSLGEYVAATVAGVLGLEDALELVAERARLIAELPEGAMLAVPLSEDEVRPLLADGLALAAVNAPGLCTVSGTPAAVAALEAELVGRGVACRRLNASHAFHSPLMEPVAERLAARLRGMRLRAPEIPFLSNVTGRPITPAEATDPEYWARHLCRTVRFAEGMREVLADPARVLLEVGPGRTLGTFALHARADATVLASLRHAYTDRPDAAFLLETAGALWMAGVRMDWAGFADGERRRRVPLPTYPFERQAYWVERRRRPRRGRRPRSAVAAPAASSAEALAEDVPAPALHARPELGVRYAAPEGDTQARLAEVWGELLGIERVGAHDDFFSLGGHSLMATRLVFQVREAFGVELSLEAVFAAPTVAGLAERVDALRSGDDASRLPPIVPVPRDRPLPLSYAQERLWVLDQLEPGSPLYNVPGAMRIRGRLDVAVAERCLAEIVRRHQVLRTVYRVYDGQPFQEVLADPEVALPVDDLRHVEEGARAAVARERLVVEAREPIDLERGPVMRTRLLRFADDDHVLLITLHHIVVDGWSWGLMFHEWEVLYVAFAHGDPSPLPDLPVQYADYAVWQRSILSGERLEEHLSYWRETLRGAPTVLELPADRPHPPVQTYAGGLYGIELVPDLMERVHALARSEGATVHLVMVAVFQAVLLRYTGQEDMVVGSLAANRLRPETQGMIGFFINTLALRARPAPAMPFRELLGRVQADMLGAYAHAELPLQMLLEDLQPERDPSRNPLVQVLLGIQTPVTHGPVPDRPSGLSIRQLDDEELVPLGDSGTSKFDLSVLVNEGAAGNPSSLMMEYNSDLFDRATMVRFTEHFRLLLEGALAAPETPLSQLSFLARSERAQLLEEWGSAAADFPVGETVGGLFEAQAARTPDAVALVFEGARLTYRELDARADALAHRLRALGVGPETRVGVCAERSFELVTALLGVLKAGGAYVPLDPSYPTERLAYILEDSAVPVLLAQERTAERVEGYGGEVVWVDGSEGPPPAALEPPPSPTSGGGASPSSPAVHSATVGPAALTPRPPLPILGEGEHDTVEGEDRSVEMPLPRNGGGWRARGEPGGGLSPDHLAYVIYTSGSTGRPKGAMNAHRGVVNRLRWMQREYGLTPGDVVLQKTPFSFDVSVWEFFWPLTTGARLVLARPEGHRDPEYLSEVIEREGVTTLHFVPSMLQAFLEAGEPERCGSVRRVVCSGEALSPEVAERFHGRLPGAELHNLYGPTEAAVDVTYHACVPGEATIPIGRPVANTRIHVLDPWMEPVPAGVPGELHIGGVQVGRGYHGRPELTAERFVPDPFAGEPGARLYRTGDRARWLASGEVEYLGRTDHQVKVRGFRIEPGEIESVLLRDPRVRECAVVAREDAPGDRRLVAYLVPADGEAPDAEALRAVLHAAVPEYMVPSAFVLLDALPLTPSGKTDRRALPAPEGARADTGEHAAPRTPAERALAAIWERVLRVERVGVRDSFFSLGGDSILAIQVATAARREGLRLMPRQLFQHATIADLARAVDAEAPVRAEQGPVTGPATLLPIQRFFFELDVPARGHWNQALLLEARRRLRPGALERAVASLAAHHDALRMRFLLDEDGWRGEGTPVGAAAPLPRVDLSGLREADGVPALERACALLQPGPALDRGPLFRAALFERGALPQRLLLVAHHLVVDGVSWRVLGDDLQAAYGQAERGEAVALPAKTTSFREWAERLEEHAGRGGFDGEAAYWTAPERGGAAPLPLDFPGGSNAERHERTVTVGFDARETRALLQELPAAFRARIDEALLAALVRALAGWSGEERFAVEVEGHGREDVLPDVDLSRTVGWFTTLFPVLLEARRGEDAADTLRAVKEAMRAVPGRGIGYGALRWMGPDAEVREALARIPLTGVRFEYHGQVDASLAESALFGLAPESAGPPRDPAAERSHLLVVSARVQDGRLEVAWSYGAGVHRAETIAGVAERFAAELRTLVERCASGEGGAYTPGDFPMTGLDQPTLDRLLGSGRDVEDVYPLTPMQEGMLFHTVHDEVEGTYVGQAGWELTGELDTDALRRAWQGVVDRHPTLRTAVVWEGTERPLQVVRRRAELPFHQEDWRDLSAEAQAARLEAWLREDRARGFDPARAPLMRLALFRTGDDRWRLLWTHHHLALDGWSVPLVFRDVMTLYGAHAAGRPARVEPGPRYRDFVAWLRERDPAADERFWRAELAGFTAATPLRVDRPAPASGAARPDYARRDLELSPAATAALQRSARAHGLTLNTLLQGAWALLLSRWSGEDDVLFGAVVAGRPAELPGVEEMVGLFINTLPVRVRTRPDRSALSWLRELQERQAELREHEHTSLVKVARWSEVPAGAPLFHTLLVFENYPLDAALGAGTGRVRVETREGIEQVSYPLALRVVPGAALGMQVQYDRERLDDDAAGRVLEHLETLLSALAAAPERRLSGISLLSAAGRERLLRGWTETPGALPDPRPLHEAFAVQATSTPEVPAVSAGGGTITYADLAARAGRLAHHLRSLGVGPESRVALGVEPGPDLVVGVLGILGAGGAYVPLDPAYPRERLARMLAGAGAEVLVTTAALAGSVEADEIERVLLDADGERIASWPDTAPDVAVDPAGLAYVIHTSGSTGTPRGVMVSHASVANLLDDFRRRAPIAPGDRCSVWTSASFDVSVWETFSALLAGGTLVFPPDEARADAAALARWLADERVRSAYLPPFVLAGVAEWAAAHPGALALRRLLVGVEPIPEATLQALLAAVPGLRILNGYGPTEATVCATLYPVEPRAAEPGRPAPIGRAVRGLRVYLADAALEPVPDGLPGELCVSGAGVARGYLGDPAATAARFVPDPFAGEPGARMYRTGDLARALPDGELEFLGRLDRQVKLRGFRVEPGEVEAVLLRHPGVREAVAQVRADAAGEPRLVAWVVPSGPPPSTEELRAHARSLLPRHMVPTAWVTLDALPLTPNGKLDARALPAPGSAEAPREHAAPRTALEEVLAGIWADVLGVPRVGVHDDFFELGGHSLLVTRIASLLRQTLQVQLPLRVLFDAHTVARLAGEVERHEAQPGRAEWTARAVLSIASMSPEEVRRRLQEREPAGAG